MTAFRDLALDFFEPAGVPGARPRPDPTLLPRARAALRAPTDEERWLLETTARALEARCSQLEAAVTRARAVLDPLTEDEFNPHVAAAIDVLDEVIVGLRIGREPGGAEEL